MTDRVSIESDNRSLHLLYTFSHSANRRRNSLTFLHFLRMFAQCYPDMDANMAVPVAMKSDRSATTPKLQFQIVSDLHLELDNQYSTYSIVPQAPYLILAGDTGSLADYESYVSFLRRHVTLYKQIFLLLGNHEFHHLSQSRTLFLAHRIPQETELRGRVTLLDRTRVDLANDVTLLGCTLWSSIPNSARAAVRGRVKDYQYIDGWSVDRHNTEHEKEVTWLREQLRLVQKDSKRRVFIITHHAPSKQGTSNPVYESNPWSAAFSTALLEGEAKAWEGLGNVTYWMFGHTHWTAELDICGVTLISNQRGYVKYVANGKDSHVAHGSSRKSDVHTYDQSRTIWV